MIRSLRSRKWKTSIRGDGAWLSCSRHRRALGPCHALRRDGASREVVVDIRLLFLAQQSRQHGFTSMARLQEPLVAEQGGELGRYDEPFALLSFYLTALPNPPPPTSDAHAHAHCLISTVLIRTGFYVLDPASASSHPSLILGPFQGKVACQTIAFGRGVCGTAASTRQTQ